MTPTLMYCVIHCIFVDACYSTIVMMLYCCADFVDGGEELGEVYCYIYITYSFTMMIVCVCVCFINYILR